MPEGVEANDVEKAEDDGGARERMLSSEPVVIKVRELKPREFQI